MSRKRPRVGKPSAADAKRRKPSAHRVLVRAVERAVRLVRDVQEGSAEARAAEASREKLRKARERFTANKSDGELRRAFADAADARDEADTALRRALARAKGAEAAARKALAAELAGRGSGENKVEEDPAMMKQRRVAAVLEAAAKNERRQRVKGSLLLASRDCSFCNKPGHARDDCPLRAMAPHLQFGDPGVGGACIDGCDWDKSGRERANWNRKG